MTFISPFLCNVTLFETGFTTTVMSFCSYHFYMALENSICQDYITEKLWNQGFRHQAVPIVLKRSLLEPYAPPHSFIAFDDFKSLSEMASFLRGLMADEKAYL